MKTPIRKIKDEERILEENVSAPVTDKYQWIQLRQHMAIERILEGWEEQIT